MAYYIGIDIGGTFTDCAVLDGAGSIVSIAKAPTRRREPDQGVIDAVEAAARRMGIPYSELLKETRFFIHGCTVATNAIVERKGVTTALITTRGHEDAILIGKGSQKIAGLTTAEMTHQSHLDKAEPPIVKRRHIFGVLERVNSKGEVVADLDEDHLAAAIEMLRREKVEAVAISLLWSFLNNDHERRILSTVQDALPGVYVCASHEVAPLLGEYERAATTVANAYVAPRLTDYIARLEGRLVASGYRYPLLLAHCMGGLTTIEEVRTRPLLTLDSGPVSGVLGARFFGTAYDEPNIICADMGGTTFDVALIERGAYILEDEPVIDRYTCLIPKVAVESIGAGGGSLVWIDDNRMLRVGPQSSGADPGPACYGRGGTSPTITDVNVILGYIDESNFLGGEMRLDRAAAEAAIDRLNIKMGLSRIEVAAGAFKIVNAHMADLIRRSSLDRGRDPRDFVLFAYGGAGPLHIAYLARDLGIGKIYVPSMATVFSAVGMLTGGVLHSAERSHAATMPLGAADLEKIAQAFETLEQRLERLFDSEQVAPEKRRYERYVYVKFRLQPRAMPIAVRSDLRDANTADALLGDFDTAYHELYGANAGYRGAGIEIVKIRIDGFADTVVPAIRPEDIRSDSSPTSALRGKRNVYFTEKHQFIQTSIYDGSRLEPGMEIVGPAVVERMGDSIVVPTFARGTVDGFRNVVLTLDLPVKKAEK
jgi:N-methylhydantoinase A